ncbi:MAG: methylmalonyl-CoA epimerase [Calditrichaeota bacterium]|nr:methylmalonyl-CoA epimerase [Calditrichota bacterium]
MLWRDTLSLPFKGIEEVPEQKVRLAVFELGPVRMELLAPTSADSPIAKFLATRGEGLHHIAVQTGNCGRALDELKRRGITLIDEKPRKGAEEAQIGFLHPKSLRGVLLELVQSR